MCDEPMSLLADEMNKACNFLLVEKMTFPRLFLDSTAAIVLTSSSLQAPVS